MIMKYLTLLALAVGFALSGIAGAATMSKNEYKAEKKRISADFKADKAKCKGMARREHEICEAQAKRTQKVAKAELEANYKNTDKARAAATKAKASADYDVAKEKCDALKGNEKDVCMKDAKAARTAGKADARVERKEAAAAKDPTPRNEKRVTEAKKDAAEDKRDANVAAAKERCDTLKGDAKDRCQADAKAKGGK
jgi:hypothetical protein